MIDEILAGIFGEAILGRLTRSRRVQLIIRVFFGMIGAFLGIVGAVHFGLKQGLTNNVLLRLSMVMMFAGLASFSLFNISLARRWRWPGILFVLSFVALFASRILFGP